MMCHPERMPMPIHRRILLVASLLLVATGLAACGDDGDDDDNTSDTTTTEAAAEGDTGEDSSSTTTGPDDDTSSTTETGDEPADTPTTTEEGSTTAPDPSSGDRPLDELLLDPATVGPGFSLDDTLGDGTLDPDLCEGTTIEETWDEQVAQALLSGTGDDAVVFQQALLRFPDARAAEAFTTTLGDALVSCEPGTEVVPVGGVGDEALLATSPSPEVPATAGIVRVGDLVGWHLSLSAPEVASPLDEALLTASADRLAS